MTTLIGKKGILARHFSDQRVDPFHHSIFSERTILCSPSPGLAPGHPWSPESRSLFHSRNCKAERNSWVNITCTLLFVRNCCLLVIDVCTASKLLEKHALWHTYNHFISHSYSFYAYYIHTHVRIITRSTWHWPHWNSLTATGGAP